MKCRICKKPANVHLKYSGIKLCKSCFINYLQKRVTRTIKRYHMIRENDKVAIALSGGKDSQVLLHILKQLYGESISILGLHIDLGIENYSQESVKFVKILSEKMQIPLHIVDIHKDYNLTIPEIKKEKKVKRPICASCGIVKRYILNAFANKLGVNALATGHLLDDEASVLLSNLVNGNIEQLTRSGPFLPSTDSTIVARIKPLYEVSEFETVLYANYNNISYIQSSCPYDIKATITSYKDVTNKLEEIQPGAKYLLIRSYFKIYRKAFQDYYTEKKQDILHCNICGGPTNREICAFCSIRKKLGVIV